MTEEQIKKLIDERIKKVIPEYLKTQAFTIRKVSDNPTDRFQVTPRGYVNAYSSVSGRPINSVIGQHRFFTDLNYPGWQDSNYRWRNGAGSVIA